MCSARLKTVSLPSYSPFCLKLSLFVYGVFTVTHVLIFQNLKCTLLSTWFAHNFTLQHNNISKYVLYHEQNNKQRQFSFS